MSDLRLGILGMSEGNGHPYSWSAIFNGYNPTLMDDCGFPLIPKYLKQHQFPRDCISGARVTHIWTQDMAVSRHIASASFIDEVVDYPEQMVGLVDGVLLARDDVENHRRFGESFIAEGIPIYVDKPFATSMEDAEDFFASERRDGQIFSCSALKYSAEMRLTESDRKRIGDVERVIAQVPNSWKKYAIHVIDPILVNCGISREISDAQKKGNCLGGTTVNFKWGSDKTCEIRAVGDISSEIYVEYYGKNGMVRTVFQDSFSAFKESLTIFIRDSIMGRVSHRESILSAIKILELGF